MLPVESASYFVRSTKECTRCGSWYAYPLSSNVNSFELVFLSPGKEKAQSALSFPDLRKTIAELHALLVFESWESSRRVRLLSLFAT